MASNDFREFRKPPKSGRRTRTLTIWATDEEVERIDAMAFRRGLSRSHFLQKCINAGFRAMKASAEQVQS